MKVLFIATVDPSGKSGHNIATKEVISALLKNPKIEVSLITALPSMEYIGTISESVKSAAFISRKKSKSVFWNLGMQFLMIPAFIRIILRGRPDCVVTRLGNCVTLPLLVVLFRIPFYVLIRGLGSRDMRTTTKYSGLSHFWRFNAALNCRVARSVYVAYKEIQDEVRMFRKKKQSPPEIFTNAVDPRLFPVMEMKDARKALGLGLSENDFVIGFAGSIQRRHSLDLLLDCLERLKNEIGHVKLLIVGDGPELKKLRRKVVFNKLEENVHFPGFIPHEHIHRYMAASDILYGVIHPNVVENPIKCYEYLACGRPVITSEKEEFLFVKDEGFGICLKSLEQEELVTAVINLKKAGKAKLKTMGLAGREYVLRNHTWDKLVDRIYKDYHSVS